MKTEICCVPDLVWRALCEIKRWICHIGCVDGVLWEFCTFLRSLRRLNASVETVSGAILAVSTVQSANFTISHFCRVWKKVVFSVKSWGTRKLYHVQEHSFGYLLVFFYRFSSKIEVFSLFWNPWWQNSNENPKTPRKKQSQNHQDEKVQYLKK